MSENVDKKVYYQFFEKFDVTSLNGNFSDLQKDKYPFFVLKTHSKKFLELFCKFFKPVRFKYINKYTFRYTKNLMEEIVKSMKIQKKLLLEFKKSDNNVKKESIKKLGKGLIIHTENKLHELCDVNILACNAIMNLESKDKLNKFRKNPTPVPLHIRTSSPPPLLDTNFSPKNFSSKCK